MWVDYIKNQTPPEPDDRDLSWRHVRRRRTNPALSRNLKPPPLGGGVFTTTTWPFRQEVLYLQGFFGLQTLQVQKLGLSRSLVGSAISSIFRITTKNSAQ